MEPDIDAILSAIEEGDAEAAQKLIPIVYDELHKIAHRLMRNASPGQTLQTTGLVHEAYFRLFDEDGKTPTDWQNRRHFFSAAAVAMRSILIDRARASGTAKRGGGRRRLDLLDLIELPADEVPADLLDLEAALRRLEVEHPQKAELVSLRFFGGLPLRKAAAIMEISTNTADRYWAFARAWLLAAMDGEV